MRLTIVAALAIAPLLGKDNNDAVKRLDEAAADEQLVPDHVAVGRILA